MKDLQGSASVSVAASPAECIALVTAVDRYPSWCPDLIREVEMLERGDDAVPLRARTTVHLALGPIANDFRFEITVTVRPGAEVVLSRIPDDPSDPESLELRWLAKPGELRIEMSGRLDVPRFLPVGGMGDSVAQGFVEAASRALAGSSPNASASSS
jgi:ribosome-associated toxin RatA of RatAB toxin-antitoxin module